MSALHEIAFLLDSPGRYWIAAGLAISVALAATFAPAFAAPGGGRFLRIARFLSRPVVFLPVVGLVLFAIRWPSLLFPVAINPDESQGIAQAITILSDPVFYRSVQSGSAGPLWTYPIALPGLLGFDLSYGTTRFVGMLILFLTLVPLYFSVRLVAGELPARVATLLGLLCFGIPRSRDFHHYASEYPALPLIGVACYLFLRHVNAQGTHPARSLFFLGLALGAVPYAKLQATVIAIAIAIFAGIFILRESGITRPLRLKRFGLFVAGGTTVPAVFSLLFLSFGVFGYFWKVYIANNLHYKERGASILQIVIDYMTTPIGYEPVPLVYKILLVCGISFCLLRLVMWSRVAGRRDHPWLPVTFATLVFLVSLYAVAAPGRHFPHYLHLIVLPLCLLCGIFMREQPAAPRKEAAPRTRAPSWGTLLGTAMIVVPTLSILMRPVILGPSKYSYPGIGFLRQFAEVTPKYPGQVINQYKKPGDHLSVWGWHADYYVDTHLPMGTRSAVSEFHIRDVPLRDYYRRHYLEEFRKRRPAFFIDAVGPLSHEFKDPELHGHQVFPELAAYVAENYVEATQHGGSAQVRFFVRRDRANEIQALPAPPGG